MSFKPLHSPVIMYIVENNNVTLKLYKAYLEEYFK